MIRILVRYLDKLGSSCHIITFIFDFRAEGALRRSVTVAEVQISSVFDIYRYRSEPNRTEPRQVG